MQSTILIYWINNCKGVFVDGIEYIILLATPIEIIFLGVAFDEPHNPRSELTLYLTHMSIPSDNVSMTSIVGTSNGRIFMCGNNGHVYELQYQVNIYFNKIKKRKKKKKDLYNITFKNTNLKNGKEKFKNINQIYFYIAYFINVIFKGRWWMVYKKM